MKDSVYVGKYTYGIYEHNVIWDLEAWTYQNIRINPKLIVGRFCSIGRDPLFYLGGNHRHDWISTYPFHAKEVHDNTFNTTGESIDGYPLSNGDIVIGNDVWFGDRVTVMSGVKIGDGAVVGTNSTVVKDVEPYSIVGGHPAKHIKYRFEPDVIDKLLKIKWWDFEVDQINEIAPLLCSNKMEEFLKIFEKKV